MWAALLVTAERGVYFATYRACPLVRKRPLRALLCRWRPNHPHATGVQYQLQDKHLNKTWAPALPLRN